MGKGTCGRTKVSHEEDYLLRKSVRDEIASEHERVASLQDVKSKSREDQNVNLIEYQEMIANDPQNLSLTKKILTKEMAIHNVNIRTENGDGLGNCVFINVKNPKAKLPWAVSADCYNAFTDFFAEVIEEIHGEPQDESLLLPQFGNLETNSSIDLNSYNRKRARVLYTEICVRRNIENLDFTPTMQSSDRQNVISIIEKNLRILFESSEEEAIVPRNWEDRMDAIKNDLDECGAMRDYPEDRMTLVFKDVMDIYEGCVLNFDDHVQYVTSTNDGRIGEIFKRMYGILADESMANINYAAHPIFGHLTLSPLHVGTGMTIYVSAKFPFIYRLADANSIIEDFDCVIEKDLVKDGSGIITLTNKKTLNTTEENIYRNIIIAFNKLSQLEDELEATTAMAVQDDAMSAENLYNLYKIIKENESMSYTKKYLTESLVSQYDDDKTNFSSTFNNCIRHNAYFPRSLYPRACDSNCYLKFARFFDPILLDYNDAKSFSHAKKPKYGSTVGDKRYQLRHPIILSYRVRFNRNFEKFPFPMMMSAKDRADVERIIIKCFEELPVELEGEYCPLKLIKDSIYYEDILKNRLFPNSCDVDISAGFYRDWPKNRGIFVAKNNKYAPNIMLVVLVNVIDHIKIIAIDLTGKGFNICYERAICMMKFLDLKFEKKYAKKSGYGFLTSVPCFVGCAMRISAHLKLKHLGDKRERLEKECIHLQLVYRGSQGHGTIAENNIFDISLRMNMNVTEQYILMIFIQKLKELIMIEREYDCRMPMMIVDDESDEADEDDNDDNVSQQVLLEDSVTERISILETGSNPEQNEENKGSLNFKSGRNSIGKSGNNKMSIRKEEF